MTPRIIGPTLASVRRAGPPFLDQNHGTLVAINYTEYDGSGAVNVRMTRQQAEALRDCLTAYLAPGSSALEIAIRLDELGAPVIQRTEGTLHCEHLTGYWINRRARTFRCYQCQYQFQIGQNLPAHHPTKGIEIWRANP